MRATAASEASKMVVAERMAVKKDEMDEEQAMRSRWSVVSPVSGPPKPVVED